MSRDASGTYTAPSNSWNPAVEGAAIDESAWNTTLQDIEDALTDSLSVSGDGKITAYIDFDEIAAPSSPAANVGRLYAADVSGTTKLLFKDSAGTVTVIADADLSSWSAVTRAAGFDTFVASPTSANLRALLTDEAGSGAAIFGSYSYGADTLLNGEEGVAFDFLSRSGAVVDYSGTLSDQDLPENMLTVSRASSATYVGRNRLLATAGSNVLRYDHDPVTGAPLGALIEPAATNLERYNRDMTNAAWTKSSITPTKDQTGVDGVANSATRLAATGANGTCLQTITIASAAFLKSAYVKRVVGSGTVQMTMDNGATWTTITLTTAWARFSIPTQTRANPVVGFRIVTSGDEIAVDYSQTEAGAVATSAIETTAATVTRSADSVSMATSLFPLDATQGTLFCEASQRTLAVGYPALVSLSDGSSANHIDISRYTTDGVGANARISSSLIVDQSTSGVMAVGVAVRAAFAYRANDFALSINGAAALTDTSGAIPSVTQLSLAVRFGAVTESVYIRRVAYISRRMTNAELQAITS